jgi:hypothetical protein
MERPKRICNNCCAVLLMLLSESLLNRFLMGLATAIKLTKSVLVPNLS